MIPANCSIQGEARRPPWRVIVNTPDLLSSGPQPFQNTPIQKQGSWYASGVSRRISGEVHAILVSWISTKTRSMALLWLTLYDERRAWKGFDRDTTDRLFKKGLIGDPMNKTKSLILTDEGLERSKSLFQELFTRQPR